MKNFIFTAIIALICYAAVEALSYTAYRIKFGDYQIHGVHLLRQEAINAPTDSGVFVPANAQDKDLITKPIIHPFVGFTTEGARRKPDCKSDDFTQCYARIKVDTDKPFAKRASNRLIIGILGGSFADGTARGGSKDAVAKAFRAIPEFANKTDVIVYNMAAGAYKQPQQLMQAAYYMSIGAEFDILINLDGFNDIAGAFYSWHDAKLHPAFPVYWHNRVSSAVSKEYLDAYATKLSATKARAKLAKTTSIFPLRWSPFINFLWRLRDSAYANALADCEKDIIKASTVDLSKRDFAYEALGPDFDIKDLDAFNNYAAEVWADSSRALRAMAEGNGTRYYHFLQPNQYIEGSKILSDYEKAHTIRKFGGYGNVYKEGRPYLVTRAEQLKSEGMSYHDLTYMFKDDSDTLYIDDCCHLNPKGYDIVVRKLAAVIAENLYEL